MVFMLMMMTVELLIYDNMDLTKLRRRRQRERQKNNRFNEQNNNFARTSHFVHFFVIPAQVRREMANFTFTWERERQAVNYSISVCLWAVPSLHLQHKFSSFQYLGDLV